MNEEKGYRRFLDGRMKNCMKKNESVNKDRLNGKLRGRCLYRMYERRG